MADQHPEELSKAFQQIGIDVPVERGEKKPQLRVQISGPKGVLDVRS